MSRSSFVQHIGDLRRDRAEARDIEVVASVEWHLELSRVLPDPDLVADLTLTPMPGGILVRGEVDGVARHTCHRCIEEWDDPFVASVAQLFVDPVTATEDDYLLAGDEIDLEPMLRDEVLLAMPLVPTCSEDCEGLVADSETDLNTDVPEAVDSRSPFAVLKDLFEPGQ